mmetsp:Transcript_9512/g.27125  ORF Transcript_9512/g.27125 Transcript_9512/m.27125 type:complete len:316 (+) Transcript_9512:1607-2554(+)
MPLKGTGLDGHRIQNPDEVVAEALPVAFLRKGGVDAVDPVDGRSRIHRRVEVVDGHHALGSQHPNLDWHVADRSNSRDLERNAGDRTGGWHAVLHGDGLDVTRVLVVLQLQSDEHHVHASVVVDEWSCLIRLVVSVGNQPVKHPFRLPLFCLDGLVVERTHGSLVQQNNPWRQLWASCVFGHTACTCARKLVEVNLVACGTLRWIDGEIEDGLREFIQLRKDDIGSDGKLGIDRDGEHPPELFGRAFVRNLDRHGDIVGAGRSCGFLDRKDDAFARLEDGTLRLAEEATACVRRLWLQRHDGSNECGNPYHRSRR